MMNLTFLMNSDEPWTRYRTLVDLLELVKEDPQVLEARATMLRHPFISQLIQELSHWPGNVISSHKSASQHFHLLAFLADLGLTQEDDGIAPILDKVMSTPSAEGVFRLTLKGSGDVDETIKAGWALCDAPLLLYSLIKMGRDKDSSVQQAMNYLQNLSQPFGWPCVVSKEHGSFRGPGKKTDPCPFATLIMLQWMALSERTNQSIEAKRGVESLLKAWDQSLEIHPYMFYMGNDFRKLKVPFIWYDIMHVLDVLSQFPFVYSDRRFQSMFELVVGKADSHGLYSPESEWLVWKKWNFSKKNQPSDWLTFLVYRIQKRVKHT